MKWWLRKLLRLLKRIANANAEEIGEDVTVEVPVKKKDHPDPLRRFFRIKTTVIKKRG